MAKVHWKLFERMRFMQRGWRYRLRVERPEVAFLLEHLAPDKTAIDIGAHKGAFTYWMAKKVGRRGCVLAFEPLPELADYLRQVAELYPLPQLLVEQTALSDQPGPRTLYVPRDDYLGMTSFTSGTHKNGYHRLSVATETLDHYLDRCGLRPVGFIKCDVEGHELEVLRGAERMLREDQPTLLLECEDHRNGGGQLERVTRYLGRLGFECFALLPDGVRPLDECREEMSRVQVGVEAFRNFGFLPRARAGTIRRAA